MWLGTSSEGRASVCLSGISNGHVYPLDALRESITRYIRRETFEKCIWHPSVLVWCSTSPEESCLSWAHWTGQFSGLKPWTLCFCCYLVSSLKATPFFTFPLSTWAVLSSTPWLPPSAATVFKTQGTGVNVPCMGRSGTASSQTWALGLIWQRASALSSHAASPSSFPR